MPLFGPISRQDLVRFLRMVEFEGPYSGGRHEFMLRHEIRIRIPNPHRGEIGRDLLARILRQAHISRDEWEDL